jgi:lambda family phage portal protein
MSIIREISDFVFGTVPARENSDLSFLADLFQNVAHTPKNTVQTLGNQVQRSAVAPFRGGTLNRYNEDWQPANTSGDDMLRTSNPLLNARFRDQAENDPSIISVRRKLVTHIIGSGIQTFSDAQADGTIDDAYNDEIDARFERWGQRDCDVERKLCWPEQQSCGFKEETAGDCFLLECWDDSPGRSMPLCYQLIEGEQIDTSKDRPASVGRDGKVINKITRGIELDAYNRAVAYHVYDAHPYDSNSGWTSKSTPIPAARVLHAFVPFRPSATRGVNWCQAIMQAAKDMDVLIDNELTAAIVASLFTVVIKRKNGSRTGIGLTDGDRESTDRAGNPLSRLGKGIIADLGVDDEIKQIQSQRPSPLLDSLVKLIRQEQAMGAGMSYLRLTSDYSQSSYTSARGAHLDDQAVFVPVQNHFANRIVVPVRERHCDVLHALGMVKTIKPRQYRTDLERWRKFDFFPVGREQLDPEMETDAAASRIRYGLSTLKAECAARGLNYRKVLRQLQLEWGMIKNMGLNEFLNWSKGGGAPEQSATARAARRERLDGSTTNQPTTTPNQPENDDDDLDDDENNGDE